MASDIYIALIHYPVLNKVGDVITTSVTNFDVHDLARTARTFGVRKVFIVTPIAAQLEMVAYIHRYWHDGYGGVYNPDRKEAMATISAQPDLAQTNLTIASLSGTNALRIGTTAKKLENSVSYDVLRQKMATETRPILVTFGTGHGLTPEFLKDCDLILDPIAGPVEYNHLPVRAAVAIILDRLRGFYECS